MYQDSGHVPNGSGPSCAARDSGCWMPNRLEGKNSIYIAILVVALAGLLLLYYAKSAPSTFGFSHDDSLYVTSAKALAERDGYRIISLPGDPAQTKYPPLYSFLLSIIWMVFPGFPDNIIYMMMLSNVVTVCFLLVTWFHLRHRQYASAGQALVIVVLVGLNWRTMIVATGIYSEMVYGLLTAVALLIADKTKETSWGSNVLLGVVLSLVVLTRSVGVSVIIAIAIYFIIKGHRRGSVAAAIGTVTLLVWTLWCYVNRASFDSVNSGYYTDYLGHLVEVIRDLASFENSASLSVFFQIVLRNVMMLVFVSIPVVVLGTTYDWTLYAGFAFVFFAVGFIGDLRRGVKLLHLYVMSYLLVHVFWLPFVSYDRFLIPLLPYLTLFFVKEVAALVARLRVEIGASGKWGRKIAGFVLAAAIVAATGIALYSYSRNGYRQLTEIAWRKSNRPAAEDEQAIEWIVKNTNAGDVIACYRDPTYFLHTGRKATRYFAMKAGVTWRAHQDKVFSVLTENEVDYLIWTDSDFRSEFQPKIQNESFKSLIDRHSDGFSPVFRATDGRSTVYRIDARRPPSD